MLHNICSEQTTVINSINDKEQSVAKTPSDVQTLCIDIAEKNKDTVNTVNNILDNLTENDASDSCNEMLEVAGEASDSESSWDSSSYSSSSFWSSDDDDHHVQLVQVHTPVNLIVTVIIPHLQSAARRVK
jgi:hypothetical protein